MLLVIDAGNTNTSLGVFNETELVAHWRLTTARSRTVDEYGVHARNLFELAGLDFKTIDAIAIASVVPPLNYTLKVMAETYFHLHHRYSWTIPPTPDLQSFINLHRMWAPTESWTLLRRFRSMERPASWLISARPLPSMRLMPGVNTLGGAITPGIMISSDALFERTAKLPRVDIRRPQTVIGSSTIAAMQSGLYHGFVGLVDGVLRKMIDEIGGAARVIATGGLAPLIATGSEFIELVDDTLTLEGLRLVYERTQHGHG